MPSPGSDSRELLKVNPHGQDTIDLVSSTEEVMFSPVSVGLCVLLARLGKK